jgi:hypothetical protein
MNPFARDFGSDLSWSLGRRLKSDVATILGILPGCVDVVKAGDAEERLGIDYHAKLRGGAVLHVDCKARKPGAARFWKGAPELALEGYSVLPGGRYNTPAERAKIGWTLSESSLTDLVLYTFHPRDCPDAFLLPFQHLRIAFLTHGPGWYTRYGVKVQDSRRWESRGVFVPAPVVLEAVAAVCRRRVS